MNRDLNDPQPGFFKVRLVRGGPLVPAALCRPCCCTIGGGHDNTPHDWTEACDRYPQLTAFVDGVERFEWVRRVWEYGYESTASEYDLMTRKRAWDETYDPASPAANPTKPVDFDNLKPVF